MRTALWLILGLVLNSSPIFASPEDADKSEEVARASFVDQFTKFMQDKNVQGRAKTPDGKIASGGGKFKFNQDDGLAFQSELTYHDYSYNTTIKEDQNGGGAGGGGAGAGGGGNAKNGQQRISLNAFVSSHGGISAAGGSSVLERTAYQLDQQFSKQDQQNKNQKQQEGVSYRSIFKITTKQINPTAIPAGTDDGKEDKEEKVDRFELRDEARPQIDKVGENSAKTILQAAKGGNDEKALGNGVLLRAAANEATKALWNSTLANLMQRRMNRGVRTGQFPDSIKLQEGVPRCEEWASVAQQVLAKNPGKQQLQQDVQRMIQQCKQLGALPYTAINPEFKKGDGGGDELKVEGPQKEDAFSRDSRLQLQVMAKAGVSVTDLPSNWQFTKQDDKAKMTISYDDNQPKEGSKTVKEQLDSYNANLKDAESGYQDIQNRYRDFQMAKPTQYAIQPGTKNMIDINKVPTAALDEVGIKPQQGGSGPVPRNYDQLLKAAQTN